MRHWYNRTRTIVHVQSVGGKPEEWFWIEFPNGYRNNYGETHLELADPALLSTLEYDEIVAAQRTYGRAWQMTFNLGDVVECIDAGHYSRIHTGQTYIIADHGERSKEWIYLEGVSGGWLPTRFKLIRSYIVIVPLDSSEYDDIILAQELYDKMEG